MIDANIGSATEMSKGMIMSLLLFGALYKHSLRISKDVLLVVINNPQEDTLQTLLKDI